METPDLVRASLVRVDTLETFDVLWNPARYRIERRRRLHAVEVLGAARAHLEGVGREELFRTELFVDTTDRPAGPGRDARAVVEVLASWMGVAAQSAGLCQVVFVWGSFRFAGVLDVVEEEWLRFDPDGTPVRAWVTVVLRR